MRRVEPPTQQQKVIDKDEWFDKLRAAKVDKQDMNMLMMDYFIKEGFADAAAAFKEESLTEPVTLGNTITPVDLSTLASRTAVRDAVQKGDMLKALDKVNELDPGILEERPKLSFRLLQERLVELIQSGKVEEALVFAQEHLAPKGEANPEFLEGLEQTLALLAFADPAAAAASPVGAKLGLGDDAQRRRDTANELNAAILSRQSWLSSDKVDPKATEPALQLLLKELLWRQKKLAEKGVSFPRVPADDMLRSSTLQYTDGARAGGGEGNGGEGGLDGSDGGGSGGGGWGRGPSPGF